MIFDETFDWDRFCEIAVKDSGSLKAFAANVGYTEATGYNWERRVTRAPKRADMISRVRDHLGHDKDRCDRLISCLEKLWRSGNKVKRRLQAASALDNVLSEVDEQREWQLVTERPVIAGESLWTAQLTKLICEAQEVLVAEEFRCETELVLSVMNRYTGRFQNRFVAWAIENLCNQHEQGLRLLESARQLSSVQVRKQMTKQMEEVVESCRSKLLAANLRERLKYKLSALMRLVDRTTTALATIEGWITSLEETIHELQARRVMHFRTDLAPHRWSLAPQDVIGCMADVSAVQKSFSSAYTPADVDALTPDTIADFDCTEFMEANQVMEFVYLCDYPTQMAILRDLVGAELHPERSATLTESPVGEEVLARGN